MATGQLQSGGVFAWPDAPGLGYSTWASMSGVHPDSPLVGGRAGEHGYAGTLVTGQSRRVALASPDAAAASDAPMKAHYSELWNLKSNPVGWVLVAAVIYLGLAHVSLNARVGKTSAGVKSG